MSTLSAQRSVIETDESQSGSPGSTIRMMTVESKSKLPGYLAHAHAHTAIDTVFREAYITSEYCLVTNVEKLGGVYVIPSQQSCTLWFGVMFVHQGPYSGGIFRFTVHLPDEFPTSGVVPTVAFKPPLFHPCVHPLRGTFDLRRHFKSWNEKQNHVWQLLRAIRAAVNKVEMSTSNKHAHDMYLNDPSAFMIRAQQEVESSLSHVYDPPPPEYAKDSHWIKFSAYDPKIHDQIRAKVLKPIDKLNGSPRLLSPYNNNTTSTSPRFGTSFLSV